MHLQQVSYVHKYFRKTCWAPTRSRPRFHTSLPRCVPEGHMQGKEVGKLWVSLCWWTWRTWVWKHEKYECLIIICHHKSGFFVLWVWKHGPGYPYLEIMQEQTQNMSLGEKLSDQNKTFLKNTWMSFSLSKIELQNDAWLSNHIRSCNAITWT